MTTAKQFCGEGIKTEDEVKQFLKQNVYSNDNLINNFDVLMLTEYWRKCNK